MLLQALCCEVNIIMFKYNIYAKLLFEVSNAIINFRNQCN